MRLLRGFYTIDDVVERLYEDESIELPNVSDISDVLELFDSKGITHGIVLLQFIEDSMFVRTLNINSRSIEIKASTFHYFNVVLKDKNYD